MRKNLLISLGFSSLGLSILFYYNFWRDVKVYNDRFISIFEDYNLNGSLAIAALFFGVGLGLLLAVIFYPKNQTITQ